MHNSPNDSGPPKRNLSEKTNLWTKLDRKATAVAEFTMRQYRKERSTWVLGSIGVILVSIVLLFYIDAMSEGPNLPEWISDNDGDGLIDEGPSEWDGSQLKSVGDVDNDGIVGPENRLIEIGMGMGLIVT